MSTTPRNKAIKPTTDFESDRVKVSTQSSSKKSHSNLAKTSFLNNTNRTEITPKRFQMSSSKSKLSTSSKVSSATKQFYKK